MLVPGLLFNASGQIRITSSIGQQADFISQGIGMMNDGTLALDTTAVPAPTSFYKGIAQNNSGACFVSVGGNSPTDVFVEGIEVTNLGQILSGIGLPVVGFTSGNPLTPLGKFAAI